MKKRELMLISSSVLLAAAVTIGVTTTSEADSETTNISVQGDVTTDPLPESLKYDSEHPDKIYIYDKVYIKTDQVIEGNEMNEATNDISKVTDNIKYIVAFDAIYVRSKE
ncbi:hypothetical protein [Paenibacillus gallinarum]|uniref:Uncharacterized protein n=1 Tax=Paenibacillus gallinarum TaxID=2762232 RepID=A0ABR8T6I1_9BACL|nr:hypothetical protein [Paenibacillus gallinarum]MBD7971205.1 hypothetical protein [Paenibacillus gallinarum]